MINLFSYYVGELKDFIDKALTTKDYLIKIIISDTSESLIHDLGNIGIDIDATFRHTLDNNAVRHVIKRHGNINEEFRGQTPITEEDLLLIPEIVSSYESISTKKNHRGQDVIVYTKTFSDGISYYVEEIRIGRHELAAITMYKRKKDSSPTLID